MDASAMFSYWTGSGQHRSQLAITVHKYLHNKAPEYLTDCCVAVSDMAGGQRLRSAHRSQLDVPRYQRTTLDRRAFPVAGPTVWNSLPDELRDETENTFRQSQKTLLFMQIALACSAHYAYFTPQTRTRQE